jgi:general secretion pathway protein C
VLEGGRLTGVRVSTGMDTALMSQIGLRPGDIVTAVNGAPVDSLARGQQIIEGLRTAASARVTVLRDGKPTDITITLK